MYRDPVCGMEVDPEEAPWRLTYLGETYYFCCLGCKEAFEEEPQLYAVAPATMAGETRHHRH